MKKWLSVFLLLLILTGTYYYRSEIIEYIMIHVVYHDTLETKQANEYHKQNDWNYVQQTDEFYPKKKQDILNVFYTALNGGWDEVTFYCTDVYSKCMDDVKTITNNSEILSTVNNFVGTFNSYNRIYVTMNNFGRVNIQFEKLYSNVDKEQISEKINNIIAEIIHDNMSTKEKIKAAHDYIINHTVYDGERASLSGTTGDNKSNTAYGPLFTGKAICGGYTDAMALFLDAMQIPNIKISSTKHIWNYVYIDNYWRHLDLTWDDPVVSTGENILMNTFFLITSEELKNQNTNQHDYNPDIYQKK